MSFEYLLDLSSQEQLLLGAVKNKGIDGATAGEVAREMSWSSWGVHEVKEFFDGQVKTGVLSTVNKDGKAYRHIGPSTYRRPI